MRRPALLLAALAFALWACEPPASPSLPAAEPVEVTVLYTSDEHGWISPHLAEGVRHGGVVPLLTRLVRDEHHCAGALDPVEGPAAARPDCTGSRTLLLSGGDHFSGPAVSTFYRGATMAVALGRLGYAASAFGNHELDFGVVQYRDNRRRSAVTYLAANMVRRDGRDSDLARPYLLVRRAGVTLGVIGLATVATPKVAMAYRFAALRFDDPEATLAKWIPEVRRQGADAVIVLAHECHDAVRPIVERHPEWHLAFVGTGHCHRVSVESAGATPIIAPGWRLGHYARVRISVDRSRPVEERAQVRNVALIEVAAPVTRPTYGVDPELERRVAAWEAEVKQALGRVIGFSKTGLGRTSPEIGRWIVRAWKERLGVDVAVTTDGGVRQELPPGPITLATVTSIMPFENQLYVVRVTGAALGKMLESPHAIVAGVEGPLDPARVYRVATTDFLYYGGDGFTFHRHDPKPTRTGVGWRTPVIEWTQAQATTPERPLESLLATP